MKKRLITSISLLLLVLCGYPQKKDANTYVSENGKAHFFSSTPVQNIEATSSTAVCVLNTQTKKISAKIQMSSFQFKWGKMQEDFNESYAESTKYPYAELEAVITNSPSFKKDGTYDVTLKGTMQIRDAKKDIVIKGKLTVKNGQPSNAQAKFDIALADYNFKIPTIVVAKIAKVVSVDVNFDFKKY
jgi:polyisoprenoid-binding protein YceI